MARIHKSIEIKAPAKEVFAYLDDPEREPEWMSGMIEVNNVKGSGVGKHFDWTYKMVGMKFKGESTLTKDVPEKLLVAETKGGIESTWTFKLEQRKDVTVLDLDIDYKIPLPVLGRVAEKILLKRSERDAETDLMNIKDRLEIH
jgi:uncharacterized membrane protein